MTATFDNLRCWPTIRTAWLAIALLLALLVLAAPALAHSDHKKRKPVAEQSVENGAMATSAVSIPAKGGGDMGAMMAQMERDRAKMSFGERLLNWLGRAHGVIVHFPLAFFPAALFTAIVGRRKPAFARPVQFLVVAGGVVAPLAALLGWFSGGFEPSTDDWLLQFHRWLGTGIAAVALTLAIWAIRKPERDRGPVMIAGLAVITAALVVQGWFGGAMVHGIGHLNW